VYEKEFLDQAKGEGEQTAAEEKLSKVSNLSPNNIYNKPTTYLPLGSC
jgi:hypothetical protein